jgi:hypothetical protein
MDGSLSEAASPPSDASGRDTPDVAAPDDAAAATDLAEQADSGDFDADDGGDADTGDGVAPDSGDCAVGDAGEFVELRCTGLYSDWASKTVASGVRQYDPGLHLWSDGAQKTRWIYLPPGQRIDTSDMDEWIFPVGTKVWKEFVLAGKRIETRLLWKTAASAWYATTYRWAADESTANELTDGELDVNANGYEVPSQLKCVQCHTGRQDYVLGFEAVALSSAGASGVTMGDLASQGLITAAPSAPIIIPGTPTEVAALGYLHANCGTVCHNGGAGPANPTGLHMRLDVARLSSVQTTDTWTTAWNVASRFPGLAGAPMRLAECDTASSGVYYRMAHRDGVDDAGQGTQMPPIDTHQVDSVAVALVAAWINEGCSDAGTDGDSSADAPSGD